MVSTFDNLFERFPDIAASGELSITHIRLSACQLDSFSSTFLKNGEIDAQRAAEVRQTLLPWLGIHVGMVWTLSSIVTRVDGTLSHRFLKWCHFEHTGCFDREDCKLRAHTTALNALKEVMDQNQETPVPGTFKKELLAETVDEAVETGNSNRNYRELSVPDRI
jgi:hypothetical protein